MTTNNNSEPRAGTTASLDKRVGRLEAQFDGLDSKVDAIALELAMVKGEIATVGVSVSTAVSQLAARSACSAANRADLFQRREEAHQWIAEPAATPAGRALLSNFNDTKNDIASLKRDVSVLQRTVLIALGGLAMLVFALEIASSLLSLAV